MTDRPCVLVTGAGGFIGAAIVARLRADGFEVRGVARDAEAAARRMPGIDWVSGDFNRDGAPDAWRPRLQGVAAVVNAAGILQDGAGDSLEAVHIHGADALFAAAEAAGIRRVVQISAIGAEPEAATAFMRTKAEGDRRLKARDLDWIVLRPGLVIGRPVYGGTGLIRGLAALPFATPVMAGAKPMQVIGLEEVAAEVARSLGPDAKTRVVHDLVHPEPHELAAIITRHRQWLGFAPVPTVFAPAWTGRLLGRVGDLCGWFGWRAPIRSTAIKQTLEGVVGDPAQWIADTGADPTPLEALPDLGPATVQDRWHARLWALRPLALVGLALFWLVSGLVALGPGFSDAVSSLIVAGLSAEPARWLTAATAALDIAVGAALLFRRWHRAALVATLLVSLAYLVGGTLLAPMLWVDPLAPLLKIVPQMLLALMLLATAEAR
ncbi:SDR family oxidoreductase [Rhodobium gokarnense]|uniref:Uncharacterized protein YbjT (DUF2867 family) n=1 Tax=Rhodobium gokarnense TaxID=364296 RepID=A0ABT3HCZ7_9HYPH|nr:SDR family oxidoreductase [Rhodobium gokarnense]MCW2308257.1 uncharacterized protein YbjT (DUF2867 family) [Rhodobium gokarnense]